MNFRELLSLSPALVVGLEIVAVLTVILIASLLLRARMFCQYLREMTGIELSPAEVRATFGRKGREGVRELLLDRTIRADLEESSVSIPPPGSRSSTT